MVWHSACNGDIWWVRFPRQALTQLDDHLARVEEYGLNRDNFPLSYNGHEIEILCNDAYIAQDGRLLFDYSLYCQNCRKESNISGRFPASDDNQLTHACNARVVSLADFCKQQCTT